jgi:hypothetical protein
MIPFLIWAGPIAIAVLVWLVFRSGGYKRRPLEKPPGAGWELTAERFVDPRSGETLGVWFCARTGERAYVRLHPPTAAS